MVETALETGYTTILFRKDDEALSNIGKFTVLICDDGIISGDLSGKFVTITKPEDLEKAYNAHGDILIIECTDREVIPLENLIARFSGIGREIYVCTATIKEAELALQTMECGASGICIDPYSLLKEGASMCIGSQSSALFLVCSESFACEYAAPRPFRVNAGAVHSYILTPYGTTCYLSELKSGSSVLVRNADSTFWEVAVGRIKYEVRSLLFFY